MSEATRLEFGVRTAHVIHPFTFWEAAERFAAVPWVAGGCTLVVRDVSEWRAVPAAEAAAEATA